MPKHKRDTQGTASLSKRRTLTVGNLAEHDSRVPSEDSNNAVDHWASTLGAKTSTEPTSHSMTGPRSSTKRESTKRSKDAESHGHLTAAKTSADVASSEAPASSRNPLTRMSSSKMESGVSQRPASIKPTQAAFGKALDESHIYDMSRSIVPDNQQAIFDSLRDQRSLSPVSEGAFQRYRAANDAVLNEADVYVTVLHHLETFNAYPSSSNVAFSNLSAMTTTPVTAPKPSRYDGCWASDLDAQPKRDLDCYITPTTENYPIAGNYFLEVNGPDGSTATLLHQAQADGATGARAIHHLRNYEREPEFDNIARTISATYHYGALNFFAHHLTEPTRTGQPPNYHMSRVGGFNLTDSLEQFQAGRHAIKNARRFCDGERIAAFKIANHRSRRNLEAQQDERMEENTDDEDDEALGGSGAITISEAPGSGA